ncbi:MAG TPA: hypothetical protein VGK54_12955 [Chloroflexota bacterium]
MSELGDLDLPPPLWDIRGLIRALRPFGLSPQDVTNLCSICVPQRGARGLQRAVLALAQLYPDAPAVARWQRAVRAWSERRPDYRGRLVDLPRTRAGPVTRFLGEVAHLLPRPLACAILHRQLHLLVLGQHADVPCYRLYLAARHLLTESHCRPEVRQALQAGRWLDAFDFMDPPSVCEAASPERLPGCLTKRGGKSEGLRLQSASKGRPPPRTIGGTLDRWADREATIPSLAPRNRCI